MSPAPRPAPAPPVEDYFALMEREQRDRDRECEQTGRRTLVPDRAVVVTAISELEAIDAEITEGRPTLKWLGAVEGSGMTAYAVQYGLHDKSDRFKLYAARVRDMLLEGQIGANAQGGLGFARATLHAIDGLTADQIKAGRVTELQRDAAKCSDYPRFARESLAHARGTKLELETALKAKRAARGERLLPKL